MMTHCRAYTGPAHGRQWTLLVGQPPDRVQLAVDGQPGGTYRLLRLRAGGAPIRDSSGNVIYLPVRQHRPGADPTDDRSRTPGEVGTDDTG